MKEEKIGLVVEGGGMKCAYSAGILDAFLDEGISFPYCIGVSAGSGNLASYLAGQKGRNLRFFTDHIHSPEYFISDSEYCVYDWYLPKPSQRGQVTIFSPLQSKHLPLP